MYELFQTNNPCLIPRAGGGSRMTEGGHKRPLCVVRSGMAVLKMLGMLEMRANQGDPADSSRTAELKNSE